MKKVLLLAALVVFVAAAANAAVLGTKHDLKTYLPAGNQQVCVFCHTPHQPTGVTTDPLWNHTLSTYTTYGVYSSVTLNAVPTDIGGGSNYSFLCLSCHDGTVGIGSLYNKPNNSAGGEDTPTNSGTFMTGNAVLGTDLSNDHPVNFPYNATLVSDDGGLEPVASLPTWALKGGSVQCSSCHNPHDNNFYPFLNATNINSQLCTECHIK